MTTENEYWFFIEFNDHSHDEPWIIAETKEEAKDILFDLYNDLGIKHVQLLDVIRHNDIYEEA